MRRYVTKRPIPLTFLLYPVGSETLTDADGAVDVTVTHVNGTVIQSSTAATHASTGTYTYTLAPQSSVLSATVSWAYTLGGVACTETATIDVVARYACDLADLRALDGIAGNATAYPTALLIAAREQAEAMFEQATGVAWSQSYQLDLLDGDPSLRRAMSNTDYIWLPYPTRRLVLSRRHPRSILTCKIDAGDGSGFQTSDESADLLYPSGELERPLGGQEFPRGLENVQLEYIHGNDCMPPDLRRAFLVYARYLVLYTTFRVPDRATMETSDAGTFLLGQANGFAKPTGLPEVDAVLQRYGVREPIIA